MCRDNYSKTLWQHCGRLSGDLRENITVGLIRGESLERMASRISRRMSVARNNAYRLVRTETAYIYEQASMKAYEQCGIEKYKYLAALDGRTSPACRELDGKVFRIKDAMPGKNYPPMHPNCRSTTVAEFDEGEDVAGTRLAKGGDGKYYEVPGDMTYKEWHKKYVGEQENEGKKAMGKIWEGGQADGGRERDGYGETALTELWQDIYHKYRSQHGSVCAREKGDPDKYGQGLP